MERNRSRGSASQLPRSIPLGTSRTLSTEINRSESAAIVRMDRSDCLSAGRDAWKVEPVK